jgi:3-hydroxyacyl-CoA dehydrogenase
MGPVTIKVDDGIGVITIDNPPVNASSQAVRQGIVECIEQADKDDTILAVVILCAGRTFIAGADINEFSKPPLEPHLPDVVARIEKCAKPVVAALHGTALGGGLEIALGAHYRVALKDAAVGLPEVNLGLLPGASGTQRLPRLAGVSRALDVITSGKPLKAPAALEAGIIDLIAEGEDLQSVACSYASSLAAAGEPPRRVRELDVEPVEDEFFEQYREKLKRRTRGLISPGRIVDSIENATTLPFDEGVRKEREYFLECKSSPQSAALRHAFFAERGASKVPGVSRETTKREVGNIAIIGAGTMGAGIAYSGLMAGCNVTLLDNNSEGLARGKSTIEGLFQGGIKRGRVSESAMADGLSRLAVSEDFSAASDADFVIEAVFENLDVKREVFTRLDSICKPGAVLATNTSTLDVNAIANATGRPRDVIGMHFFSPAHIMKLVEIVRGDSTSPEVIATTLALTKRLRKTGVVVGNCFGFVGNRMLYSYGRENQMLMLEGAAPEFIDEVLYDFGMAMGPNAVGDLAGLDVGYKVRQGRKEFLPDPPNYYHVANVLAGMGRYGQKTGKGMYIYADGSRIPSVDPEVHEIIRSEAKKYGIPQREVSAEEIQERCILGLVLEGVRILEEGIAIRAGDIDTIWINGYGFPRWRGGPMHYAETVGLRKICDQASEYGETLGGPNWEIPELLKQLAAKGEGFPVS